MQFYKHAYILRVIQKLHQYGSWTGKTHVHKALSLLRDLGKVPVPFEFVLYKHGPYSFEVEAELEQMRSYGAITMEPNTRGYGVVLKAGEAASLVEQSASLSAEVSQAIDQVCRFVSSRSAAELERLATASWIRYQERLDDPAEVARRLHFLKPHVSIVEAERADADVRSWREGSKE